MTRTTARPLLHRVMNSAADNLVPFQATIEVTSRCNLSCKHCYIDVRAEHELSLAEFKGVLDQLAESGTMYLLFTGGEPFTRPDFLDIAFYAREKGFMIMFLTNGTLITPAIGRDIMRLEPIFVGMSLHGATPDTHDGITGKQGSFTSMMQSIELLQELGIRVSLQTLLMDTNVHEAAAIKGLARSLGAYHVVSYQFVPTRRGSLSPFNYEADPGTLFSYFDSEPLAEDPPGPVKGEVCKAGRGICAISAAGDVSPCLMMPMKVGNIREAAFTDIWIHHPSPELTRLRSLTWDDLTECRNCHLARYCQKCMGVAYSETGSLTKPAPSACRNAAIKAEFFRRKGVIA